MSVERVKKCFKLLIPDGWLWWDKLNGGDLESTANGFAIEYSRVLDAAKRLEAFFLPYLTAWIPELEKLLDLPNENLTDEERQGRVDSRMQLLFAEKGRFALYESIMATAGFGDVVVRNLGAYGVAESPYDFFKGVGLAFYDGASAVYNGEGIEYNNTGVEGSAYLVTNGGSVNLFDDPDTAVVNLEQNPLYWVDYIVVEGPTAAEATLQVPRSKIESFFDLVYLWKPGDAHVILNVEFTE